MPPACTACRPHADRMHSGSATAQAPHLRCVHTLRLRLHCTYTAPTLRLQVAELLDSRIGHATSLLLVRLLCLVGESAATPCDTVALKQAAVTAGIAGALVRAWCAWKRDAQGAPTLFPHERPSAGCRFFGWLCKGDDAGAPARIRHVLDAGALGVLTAALETAEKTSAIEPLKLIARTREAWLVREALPAWIWDEPHEATAGTRDPPPV